MRSKSVLRRLEQLEKKALPPKRESGGFVVVDHWPTDEEATEYVNNTAM